MIDAFFGFAFVGCVVCLWNSVLVGFEYGFRVWTEFNGFGVSVGSVLCVGFVEVIGEVDGAFVKCVVFGAEFESEVGGDEFLKGCECDVCVHD